MTYSFSEELKWRTRSNLNSNIAIVGSPGCGKSYFACCVAEKVDPDFNINRVAYSLEEFNDLINSGLPKGSALVLDEAGVTLNARTWYTLSSRMMNQILITYRSSCIHTFFCLPSLNMLDSQSRRLLHYIAQPVTINRTTNISRVKLFRSELNPILSKMYNKFAWANVDGTETQIKMIECPLPSLRLRRDYEAKKAKFRETLGKSIKEELEQAKINAKSNVAKDVRSIVQEIITNPKEFQITHNKRTYISKEKIMWRFNLGESTANKAKVAAEAELDKAGGGSASA